jgi:hypothetical protein
MQSTQALAGEQFPDGLGGVRDIKDVIAELLEKDDSLHLMNEPALKRYFSEGILEGCGVKIDTVRLDRFDNEVRLATVLFTGSTQQMHAFARIQRVGLREPWERDLRHAIGESMINFPFG